MLDDAYRSGLVLAPPPEIENRVRLRFPGHSSRAEPVTADPPPRAENAPRTGVDGEGLPLSGSPAAAPVTRRRETRYLASVDRLWMQWWADGEHNGLPARLVNVSRHGAMIVSPVLFETSQMVRIYLEDAPTPVGVESIVLGVNQGRNGRHQVRLSFVTACPDAFFEAAAHGFEAWLTGRGGR